jgi:hypothetical protein
MRGGTAISNDLPYSSYLLHAVHSIDYGSHQLKIAGSCAEYKKDGSVVLSWRVAQPDASSPAFRTRDGILLRLLTRPSPVVPDQSPIQV